MSTTKDLESILIEYEQQRRLAELDLENRKKNIYKKYPHLYEIDENINKLSILKTKNALLNNQNNVEIDNNINNLKKEKIAFLNKEKIDILYFSPNYNCKKCNDTGFITYPDKKSQMCSCLKQKLINISYNKSNLNNLQKENFNNFNLKKFSNKVDIKKYNMNLSPQENIKAIKNACLDFINTFDNPDTKNLLFTGNTGLGKTYMSNCIANELLNKGKTVLYQTAPLLLETIIDNKFNKYKTSENNDFYNQVLTSDLLIIDDLGTESLNSVKLSELFTIINSRSLNLNNKITKTLISTNLSIEKIFSIYEERIGSRIAGFYDIYYFFGEDLRLKK